MATSQDVLAIIGIVQGATSYVYNFLEIFSYLSRSLIHHTLIFKEYGAISYVGITMWLPFKIFEPFIELGRGAIV